MNIKLFLSTIAAASAFAGTVYAADVVTGGDLTSADKWYGRAGGLTGSDRVTYLRPGQDKVGVGFDQEVAERTNMHREPGTSQVGISRDAEVAARTNMPIDRNPQPAATAGAQAPVHN
jgi:opacity protein-like surface antigen